MNKLLHKILAFTMFISLCGCANNNNVESSYDTSTLEGTTITIWTTFSNTKQETLLSIIDDFNATNPYGIKVVHERQVSSTVNFNNSLYDNIMAGTGPDLTLTYSTEVPRYFKANKVVDVSPYISDPVIGIPNYEAEKGPDIMDIEKGFSQEGQYFVVTQLTGLIQYYNKTLYDELGLTPAKNWEELRDNAKAITKAKGIPGFGFDSLTDCIQMYLKQHGSDIITLDSKNLEISEAELQEAFDYFKQGVDEGYFQISFDSGYASNTFILGGIGGYFGSCAGFPNVEDMGIFGDLDRQEVAYAELPLIKNKWNPAFDRGFIIFNNNDENKILASYLFMKYFTSAENSSLWCQAFIAISPYSSVNTIDEYQKFIKDNGALQAFMNQTVYSGELPNVVGTSAMRSLLATQLKLYVSGEQSFDDTYDIMKEEAKKALADD